MPDIEMTVRGTYTYDASSEIVTVVYRGRKKSTQLGGSTPEAIARLLLGELVDNPEGPGTSKA
jgi:hypothetical protein